MRFGIFNIFNVVTPINLAQIHASLHKQYKCIVRDLADDKSALQTIFERAIARQKIPVNIGGLAVSELRLQLKESDPAFTEDEVFLFDLEMPSYDSYCLRSTSC
jgi:hypothetical protein